MTWSRRVASVAAVWLAATPPPSLAGQGVVRGTVYDSLLGAPLGGAEVWILGTARHAVTDPLGRFHLDSVPPGPYVLVLAHGDLDSAGLFNLTAPVTVGRAGDTVTVTLAVPSRLTFWRRGCGAGPASPGPLADSGIVFGVVDEATTGAHLAGASVAAAWIRLTQRARLDVAAEQHDARTRTDSTGAYYLCGLPRASMVRLRAYGGVDSTGGVDVLLGPRGVARGDLTLALGTGRDPAARPAAATLRGTVKTPEGRPVASARVRVRESAATVTEGDGAFLLTGLPAGTQIVAALAIGREPLELPVVLRPGDTLSLALTLSPRPITLDTLRIIAARQSWAIAEVEERRRAGSGYHRTEEQLARMGSIRGVFSSMPSVRFARTRAVFDVRPLLPSPSAGGSAYCVPPLFIDGFRADYEELRGYRPSDLLAVEMYPRPSAVPARFQSVSGGCGILLVWTKYLR
jgi:hypothetical protein